MNISRMALAVSAKLPDHLRTGPSSSSSSSGLSANFNKLKALALELGVHGQRCAQFRQYKNSDGADG